MIPKGTKAIYLRGQMIPNAAGDYFGILRENEWQTLQLAPTTYRIDFTARINVEQSGTAPQIEIQRDATFTGIYFEATSIVLF
jgi:hypothetical protein